MRNSVPETERETERERERHRERQRDIRRYRAPPRSEPKIQKPKLVRIKFTNELPNFYLKKIINIFLPHYVPDEFI